MARRVVVYATSGYNTTHKHKLYQGFFVEETGEGLSVTPYYDWVRVVTDAFVFKVGRVPCDVVELETWLGRNIQSSLDMRTRHRSTYLSIAAALGAEDPVLHLTLLGPRCGGRVSTDSLCRFSGARSDLTQSCPCGTCSGPGGRHLCRGLEEGARYVMARISSSDETTVPSQRYDLVMGNNLTLLHGGASGGPSRLLLPICFVMDNAAGQDYEAWLAHQWRSRPMTATTTVLQ